MTTAMTKPSSLQTGLLFACLLGASIAPFTLSAQVEVTEIIPDDAIETPVDGVVRRSITEERQVLAYPPVREADIVWEKRIWRVLDVREKQNLPFIAPESPLFTALREGALDGSMYVSEDDAFKNRMSTEAVRNQLFKRDTVMTVDVETGEEIIKVVENEINWENVKRYRIKESWYFDARTSQMKVRILGIAPLYNDVDEMGNFRFERPLFWIYYPSAREELAQHRVVTPGGNVAANMTWEDWLEMRFFASVITKESNTLDRKIENYLTGVDALMEGRRIQDAIFNFEHDMWQQ
jgi:gliding motility associated protien GldN